MVRGNYKLYLHSDWEGIARLGSEEQWVVISKGGFFVQVITFNKAVRDLIPDIIRATGKECVVEHVSDAKFLALLSDKLGEEVAEYQAKPSLEELADILEVMHAIVRLSGHTWGDLEQERAKKASLRGAFANNLVLLKVEESLQPSSFVRSTLISMS